MAGILHQIQYGAAYGTADGLTPSETLSRISIDAHTLVGEQYDLLNGTILPALEREGIRFLRRGEWSDAQDRWITRYFTEQLLPIVTPIRLDPVHPFPSILNKSLNFIVSLTGEDAFGQAGGMAVVQAPRALPRLIRLPADVSDGELDFVFLSSVIHARVGDLFPGMELTACHQFRVTRNSELFVDAEDVDDLMRALVGELPSRRYGDEVRLEVADICPGEMVDYLVRQFELSDGMVFRVNGPVNLHRLMALPDLVDRPDLKYQPFTPGFPARVGQPTRIFEAIAAGDILLHHPFQSFAPVLDFVHQAAADPDVLAIKQTLYRTGAESSLVDALVTAARAGKEVTVCVELRARFDEEANISLAEKLQEAGAHVVYGVVGYKTHAKMLLVVRREGEKLRRYVHLGTGNYHASTARIYTDFGLLTADSRIGEDVHEVFMQLTGLGRASRLTRLLQSPFTLHDRMLEFIDEEAGRAAEGKPRPHHREDERADRSEDHPSPLPGVSGGGRDRSRRSRRLCAAAGHPGGIGKHPGTLDRRPVPGAHPRVLLRERRRPTVVLRKRGLDEPQPLPTRRDLLPHSRYRAARAGDRRGPHGLPRRQHACLAPRSRRALSPDRTRRRARGLDPAQASRTAERRAGPGYDLNEARPS